MHVTPGEKESVNPNKKSKSSEFMYHKKYDNTDTSAYDKVLNALKKLDTLYNPTMPRMHETVIEGKYIVTGDTSIIPIVVEHEENKIHWA